MCVFIAEMFATRFSFKKQAFPMRSVTDNHFCANLVYLSAKKNVRSCTQGDLKNCVQVVFSAWKTQDSAWLGMLATITTLSNDNMQYFMIYNGRLWHNQHIVKVGQLNLIFRKWTCQTVKMKVEKCFGNSLGYAHNP